MVYQSEEYSVFISYQGKLLEVLSTLIRMPTFTFHAILISFTQKYWFLEHTVVCFKNKNSFSLVRVAFCSFERGKVKVQNFGAVSWLRLPSFQCRGFRFCSWLGELRSHMPRGRARKKKKSKFKCLKGPSLNFCGTQSKCDSNILYGV